MGCFLFGRYFGLNTLISVIFIKLYHLFQQAQKTDAERLVLRWESIDFSVKNKKILRNVSGQVENGEMLASAYFSPILSRTVLTVVVSTQSWAPRAQASPPFSM